MQRARIVGVVVGIVGVVVGVTLAAGACGSSKGVSCDAYWTRVHDCRDQQKHAVWIDQLHRSEADFRAPTVTPAARAAQQCARDEQKLVPARAACMTAATCAELIVCDDAETPSTRE